MASGGSSQVTTGFDFQDVPEEFLTEDLSSSFASLSTNTGDTGFFYQEQVTAEWFGDSYPVTVLSSNASEGTLSVYKLDPVGGEFLPTGENPY